jgi:energy-coupling factor transporter ATP-binding protein EcfA2
MAVRTQTWAKLLEVLDLDEPADQSTYVEPAEASSARIARQFLGSPRGNQKFLLIGPKGGGKSTELRAIARALRRDAVAIGIDTDASGVPAKAVSAFDIMYLTGLAFLHCLRKLDPAIAKARLPALADAYGGEAHVANVDTVDKALEGLAVFVESATPVAAGLDLVTAGMPLATSALKMVSSVVRLLPDRTKVVSEASPQGVALANVCSELAGLVGERFSAPLCVLVDGLEKMNGESAERFDAIFEQTRLIGNAPWSAVFAAPPCTMTQTHSASDLGYREQPVYGFPPADSERLRQLVERRLTRAGMTMDNIETAAVDELVSRVGSLPRHMVRAMHASVLEAQDEAASRIQVAHVTRGLRTVAIELARGLAAEDYDLLKAVDRTKLLPRDLQAATLYADGRILSLPPSGDRIDTEWVVHPLLRPLLQQAP